MAMPAHTQCQNKYYLSYTNRHRNQVNIYIIFKARERHVAIWLLLHFSFKRLVNKCLLVLPWEVDYELDEDI